MVLLLQWNARSLVVNGQEIKHFIDLMPSAPDVICVQETWLKPILEYRILNYIAVRCDRDEGVGGGCATFIKEDIPFRVVNKGKEEEYIAVEIWTKGGKFIIINYYNPCRKLDINKLKNIQGQTRNHIIWCGDFNSHSTLWGGKKTFKWGGSRTTIGG